MGEFRHHFLPGHAYALLIRQFTDRLTFDSSQKAWLSRPPECVLSASWNLSATINFSRLLIKSGKAVCR